MAFHNTFQTEPVKGSRRVSFFPWHSLGHVSELWSLACNTKSARNPLVLSEKERKDRCKPSRRHDQIERGSSAIIKWSFWQCNQKQNLRSKIWCQPKRRDCKLRNVTFWWIFIQCELVFKVCKIALIQQKMWEPYFDHEIQHVVSI